MAKTCLYGISKIENTAKTCSHGIPKIENVAKICLYGISKTGNMAKTFLDGISKTGNRAKTFLDDICDKKIKINRIFYTFVIKSIIHKLTLTFHDQSNHIIQKSL